MSTTAPDPVCEHCGLRRGQEMACRACGVLTLAGGDSVMLASRWRRLAEYLLDSLLFVVTFGVGWLIWMHFTAQTSQSPAKRLLNTYIVVQREADLASYERVWVRDVVVLWLLFGILLSSLSGGIVPLVDMLWILFDPQKQTLHDKVVDTVIVYAPLGLGERTARRGPMDAPSPPGAGAPAPGGPESYASTDTQARLRALRRMWERGEIGGEEYERRRREVLNRD